MARLRRVIESGDWKRMVVKIKSGRCVMGLLVTGNEDTARDGYE